MRKSELFNVTIDMSSVFLYKEDLLELESLLRKNIDNIDARSGNLEINIDQSNKSVSIKSFAELKGYDLEKTQSMSINANNWHNNGEEFLNDKSIRISIRPLAGDVTINGYDEVWVYGMEKKIISFLKKKRTFINKFYKAYDWMMPLLIGASLSNFFWSFIKAVYDDDNISIVTNGFMMIGIGILGYFLNKVLSRWIKFSEIHFVEKNKSKRLSVSDKIQIFGIIFAFITTLIFFLLQQNM